MRVQFVFLKGFISMKVPSKHIILIEITFKLRETNIYKYFVNRKWAKLTLKIVNGDHFHPSKMIINLGFASVDNHFLGVKILTITLSAMMYLYNEVIGHLVFRVVDSSVISFCHFELLSLPCNFYLATQKSLISRNILKLA